MVIHSSYSNRGEQTYDSRRYIKHYHKIISTNILSERQPTEGILKCHYTQLRTITVFTEDISGVSNYTSSVASHHDPSNLSSRMFVGIRT